MSKFWQKKYTSKYTGAEIDAAVAKAGDATKVTANPTLAGTEAALEGLQVGNTKYKVGGGSGLVITATENEGTITFDKTFAEVEAAYDAGVNIWINKGRDGRHLISFSTKSSNPSDPTQIGVTLRYDNIAIHSDSTPIAATLKQYTYMIDNLENVMMLEESITVEQMA